MGILPKDKVRISVEVPRHVHDQMRLILPWGLKRPLMEAILRMGLRCLKENGIQAAGEIIDGKYRLVRVLDTLPTEREMASAED